MKKFLLYLEERNFMKKLLSIFLLGLLFQGVCFAEDSSLEDEMLASAQRSFSLTLPFYRSLTVCRPFDANINGYDYKIYGFEDERCHFQIGVQHCYLPDRKYESYATSMLNYNEKMLRDIKHGELHFSSEDPELEAANNIVIQYCKL